MILSRTPAPKWREFCYFARATRHRSIFYGQRIKNSFSSLPRTAAGRHIADQLLRSATSVAANYAILLRRGYGGQVAPADRSEFADRACGKEDSQESA